MSLQYEVAHTNFKNFIRSFLLNKKHKFNKQTFFLIHNMDGKNSIEDLKRKFKARFLIELTDESLKRLIRKLKKLNLILRNKNGYPLTSFSRYYISKLKKRYKAIFKKKKIRDAIFDGLMYKANPRGLTADLKKCFASVNEKKLCHILRKINILKGVIVPHSNMELSGTCAAWAYKAIELMGLPDIVILLVPNHATQLRKYPFAVCKKSFRMPFGIVQVDKSFISRLAKGCVFNIFQEDLAYAYEHAIEIQLPFLHFIYNSTHKYLSIVPIICNLSYFRRYKKYSGKLVRQFLHTLRSCIAGSRERVLVIASGDLHHQRGLKISADFHEKNQKIIQAMENAKKKSLHILKKEGIYTCCQDPFLTFLEVLKPKQGFLLDYSWSGRKNPLQKSKRKIQYDWIGQIGFASMVF